MGALSQHCGVAWQFPEHTVEFYEMSRPMGADILECDVSFTRAGWKGKGCNRVVRRQHECHVKSYEKYVRLCDILS